jgi:hypothetical protein
MAPAPDPSHRKPNHRLDRFLRFGVLRDDAEAWCVGRSWVWRAPLVAYLGWAGVGHLRDPLFSSLFGGITLGIHELGHVLFSFAGRFFGIAGGSLLQIVAPAVAGWLLWRQRDYFGVAVTGAWEAFSLWNLATYIGDARARELPLDDWNWLLSTMGILGWDRGLATLTRFVAFAIWVAAMTLESWLCWKMAAVRRAPASVGPP